MTGKTTIAAMLASVALLTMPAFAQTATTPDATAGSDAQVAPADTAATPTGTDDAAASTATTGTDSAGTDKASKGWNGKMRHHGDRKAGMRVAPPFFAQFDTNGDGVVSEDEVEAASKQLVDKYGTDGTMDVDQFETMMTDLSRPSIERAFKHLDANEDGKLDESEAANSAKRFVGAKIWQPKDQSAKDAAPDAAAPDAEAPATK